MLNIVELGLLFRGQARMQAAILCDVKVSELRAIEEISEVMDFAKSANFGVRFIIEYTKLYYKKEKNRTRFKDNEFLAYSILSGELSNCLWEFVSEIMKVNSKANLNNLILKVNRIIFFENLHSIPFFSKIMILYLGYTKVDPNIFWNELEALKLLNYKILKYLDHSVSKNLALVNKYFYERYNCKELLPIDIIPKPKSSEGSLYKLCCSTISWMYNKAFSSFIKTTSETPHYNLSSKIDLPFEIIIKCCDILLYLEAGLTAEDIKKYQHIVGLYENAELDNFCKY